MSSRHAFSAYGRSWNITVDDEVIADDYVNGRFHEHHMLDWMLANIPAGGLWVDCGANIGNHSLAFATRADIVVAFEPIGQNFALLKLNLADNGVSNVVPQQVGVGKEAALMGFRSGGVGRNSQFELVAKPGPTDELVAVLAVDSAIPHTMDVRVIKIDVEGMETPALNGCFNTIVRCRPELFIEIWDAAELERITKHLLRFGYTLIERWNHAPTYHFSASGRYPVTYTPPA